MADAGEHRKDVAKAYEQFHSKEQNFGRTVLDRFNYFLISSAFLVTAFATTVIYKNSLSLFIAFVGVVISFGFFIINYINACFLNRLNRSLTMLLNERYETFKISANDDLLTIYTKLDQKIHSDDDIGKYFLELPSKVKALLKMVIALNPCLKRRPTILQISDFNNQGNYFSYVWIFPFIAFVLWVIATIGQSYKEYGLQGIIWSLFILLVFIVLFCIAWNKMKNQKKREQRLFVLVSLACPLLIYVWVMSCSCNS